MSREYKLFVLDVIEFCEKVIRYTAGKQEHEFFADEMALDAVMRNLELIGEASKNIPETVRSQIPNIDWRNIIAMRNWIAHAYFGVRYDIVWHAVQLKVPELLAAVRAYAELHQISK